VAPNIRQVAGPSFARLGGIGFRLCWASWCKRLSGSGPPTPRARRPNGHTLGPKNVWLMHDSRVNRLLGDFIQKMVGAERPCTDDAQCPRTDDNQ
jgi:hypothetical protein